MEVIDQFFLLPDRVLGMDRVQVSQDLASFSSTSSRGIDSPVRASSGPPSREYSTATLLEPIFFPSQGEGTVFAAENFVSAASTTPLKTRVRKSAGKLLRFHNPSTYFCSCILVSIAR